MIFKLVFAALLLCAAATSGAAATYTVTSLADSGPGSLRQAIRDANASPAPDTINFNEWGPIAVTSPLIITGNSSNRLTIAGPQKGITFAVKIVGNNATPIFVIQSGVVSISNVWIFDGRATGAFPSGGGIYSSATSLTLDRVYLLGNSADLDGGGIFIDSGTLTMKDSSVSHNKATRNGGGIALDADASASITNSQISENQLLPVNQMDDAGGGGGIALAAASPGTAASILTLTNSTVLANTTTAGVSGGGISAGTGSVVTLERARILQNTAAGDGGGLAARFANLMVTNSVIGGNSARSGGGIYRDQHADLPAGNIFYSTIAKNTATIMGGGLAAGTVNPINVRGTIIADNTAPDAPDILGSVSSQGYNLFGSLDGAAVTGTPAGNIIGLDPMLGPILGGNGTLSLNAGSPAIDAGDPTNFTSVDQRGRPRPWDGDGDGSWLPDIGAFERVLGTVQFQAAATRAPENILGGVANVEVRRDSADGDVTVAYTVSNGSAVLGSDYQAVSGTFTFTGGGTLGYIRIPLINDATEEPDETIIINLTEVTPGARLGSPTTAVVTIVNDDFTVSGRVATPTGQGLRNATVQLVNAHGAIRTATTSSFGTYSFENVRANEPYTIRVISKRYRFAPRTGSFQASAANIDFAALE